MNETKTKDKHMSASYERVITGTRACSVCEGRADNPKCKCKGRGEFYTYGHRRTDEAIANARRTLGFVLNQDEENEQVMLDALRHKLAH